jgi:hypothetical protein
MLQGRLSSDLFGGRPLGVSFAFLFSSNIKILQHRPRTYREGSGRIHTIMIIIGKSTLLLVINLPQLIVTSQGVETLKAIETLKTT